MKGENMFDTDERVIGKRVSAWVNGRRVIGRVEDYVETKAATLYVVWPIDNDGEYVGDTSWYMVRHQFIVD